MAKKATQATPPPISIADGRPQMDDLRRIIDEAAAARGSRMPGRVVNRQIDRRSGPNFDGTPAYFVYYVLDPPEIKTGRLQRLRDDLAERGYWLADGEEYVPECSTAEIWMTYADLSRAARGKRAQEAAARTKNQRRLAVQ